MLPFLAPKKAASVIVARMGKRPDIEVTPEHNVGEHNEGLHSACEDILRAIETKSVSDLASALQYAFECMEAAPHEEAEHEEGE